MPQIAHHRATQTYEAFCVCFPKDQNNNELSDFWELLHGIIIGNEGEIFFRNLPEAEVPDTHAIWKFHNFFYQVAVFAAPDHADEDIVFLAITLNKKTGHARFYLHAEEDPKLPQWLQLVISEILAFNGTAEDERYGNKRSQLPPG